MSQLNPLTFLLDLLFPRHNLNYTSISRYLTDQEIVSIFDLKKKKIDLDSPSTLENIFYCTSFKNPIISDLLHRAKFGGQLVICNDLVKVLQLVFNQGLVNKPDCLAFVPADPQRYRQRNYHIPQILATKLAGLLDIELVNLFEKKFTTIAQSELSKEARLVNLNGVFKLLENSLKPQHKEIYILDDVTTTGTTITELANLLSQYQKSIRITGLALAG